MSQRREGRSSAVIVVSSSPQNATQITQQLSRISNSVKIVVANAREFLQRADSLLPRLEQSCIVAANDLDPAALVELISRTHQHQCPLVLAPGVTLPPSVALLDLPHVIAASSRLLDPTFVTFVQEIRKQTLGELNTIFVRSPGGRRIGKAASTRTAFTDGTNHVTSFDERSRNQLAELFSGPMALVDVIAPGASDHIQITDAIASLKANKITANTKQNDICIEFDLDEEMQGEALLEIEAVMSRGSLFCRFATNATSLTRKAVLQSTAVTLDDLPSVLEIAVRHAIANQTNSPASYSKQKTLFQKGLSSLDAWAERLKTRPISMIFVHVPRFRNNHDELELPSLATARLAAFTRGFGFSTHVVDLQILHGNAPLDCFTDDKLVDEWLQTETVPNSHPITAQLSPLFESIRETIKGRTNIDNPCMVGFSIVDYFGHFQMNIATCLARLVKKEFGFTTVLGGERDQVDGDRALANENTFDYVVDGDGETPIFGLLHLRAYNDRKATMIPGVWVREGDKINKNKLIRTHLNAMPRPDFDDVDFSRYLGRPTQRLLDSLAKDGLLPESPIEPFVYLPYAFVKGCTAKCEFCSSKEWLDVQSPEKTANDLLAISEKYKVKDFMFLNNLVNVSPKMLEKFCRLLIDSKAGLQWTDSCRPTDISRELAAAMRESGCLLLNYGAESGSDKILNLMKKGLLSKDIIETLQNTHSAGIINRVNFIAGYFHETPDDVDATIRLVETLSDEIDIVGCFQGFYLFPGMGVEPEKAGIVMRPTADRLKTGQLTLAYDEIGGLKWEEKRETIDSSRNRILKRMEDLQIRTLDKINEYDLFWLSRRFNKATVTKYLLQMPPEPSQRKNQAVLPPGGQRGRVEPMP